MPFTILLYSFRKPGTTPTSFKTHYESQHIPLLKSLTGTHFPKSHKRFYIQRTDSTDTASTTDQNSSSTTNDPHQNDNYPATVLVGTQPDFPYDALAELTFDDAAKFHTFMDMVSRDEAKELIARDEEMFLDRGRMTAVVVGETVVTEG